MKARKTVQTFLLSIVMTAVLFSSLVTIPEEAMAYTPHAPIRINGNGDFTAANGVISGNGIPSDPYVIGGWEINASTAIGIEIQSVDVHFIIRDSYIHSGGWNFDGMYFLDVSNGKIQNVTLSGNDFGMYLDTTNNISISGNRITSSSKYAISIWDSLESNITGNNISSNAGVGISLYYSVNATIMDNNLPNNMEGINLEDSPNAVVSRNNISYSDMGIWTLYSDDIIIAGNTIHSTNASGIDIHDSRNATILGNTLYNCSTGIYLDYSENATVSSNTFTDTGMLIWGYSLASFNSHVITVDNLINGLPVYYYKNSNNVNLDGIPAGQLILANCTNVSVAYLNISNADIGVQMGYVRHFQIRSSVFHHNNLAGIASFMSENITISRVSVSNSVYGFTFWHSSNISITESFANSIEYQGIQMFVVDNALIENSEVAGSGYGIAFDRAEPVLIIDNSISDNWCGLYVENSLDLVVYHNNFINNTFQVYLDGFVWSTWDDGYPSGGNYWSDYNGTDTMNGPNQNLPGSDGIGDTPYVIDLNNRDRYPLMVPFSRFLPNPPTMLSAMLSGNRQENVTLVWELSSDDGVGLNNVIGYDILRNVSFDPSGQGYQLIASVPNGTTQYEDISAGEGDPDNYFYQVCAVDSGGNTTCAERQAGKFTRFLSDGPNLVSIPLIQSDESIETVFQTIEYDKAWTYEAFKNRWISYTTFKPYEGELKTVNHRIGIWINVTQASNLTVAGIVPRTTSIRLVQGWNLVGFPSFDSNYTVGELKLIANALRVEGFESSAPPYFLRALSDTDTMEAGYGYWFFSAVSDVWFVQGY